MAKIPTNRFKPVPRKRTYFREWRKYRKMTLETAAEASGMSVGNLSAMERGGQTYSQDGLEALAVVYKCDPGHLLNVDPGSDNAFWQLWDSAKPQEREQLTLAATAFLRPRKPK